MTNITNAMSVQKHQFTLATIVEDKENIDFSNFKTINKIKDQFGMFITR